MAITVRCDCGKKTVVSDALAGKRMRCPGCGNEVAVVPAGQRGAKGGGQVKKAGPAFELSGGQKIGIAVVGGLIVIGCIFYFGPMRVSNQWSAMQVKATQDVQDLVIDSLRQHMKEEDPDPADHRFQPTVEEHDVTFLSPMLAFSLPDEVGFIGKSNQGTFGGNYNIRTGQVDATVSYGGYTVAGMVDVKKAKGTYHLVGRMLNGRPQMEIDGKKI